MQKIEIVNSNEADLDLIFEFYRAATEYQKPKFKSHWPRFSRKMVLEELKKKRQFKLLINGRTACVWAVAFSDPEIWGKKNEDAAVYLHRIATHADFRGQRLIANIVSWAKNYALMHKKNFIRMDTVGENHKLIAHYQKCGFTYLGLSLLKETHNLPAHYHNAVVSLFEIKVTPMAEN